MPPNRVTNTSVKVEYESQPASRVTSAGVNVEYSNLPRARATVVAILIEYQDIYRSKLSGYLEGGVVSYQDKSRKAAYLSGSFNSSDSNPSYVIGSPAFEIEWIAIGVPSFGTTASSSKAAYLKGSASAQASQDVYISGWLQTSAKQSAFLVGSASGKDNTTAYILGIDAERSRVSAYLAGISTTSDQQSVFLHGSSQSRDSNQAYILGIAGSRSVVSAYLSGTSSAQSSQDAYAEGVVRNVKHAYVVVGEGAISSKTAFMVVSAGYLSSVHAYLSGVVRSKTQAYLKGEGTSTSKKASYLRGASSPASNKHAYLNAAPQTRNSHTAYLAGSSSVNRSAKSAFLFGVRRSTISVYLMGYPNPIPPDLAGDPSVNWESLMTTNAYITMNTSDGGATVSKRFRVLTQDYNDGGLSKQVQLSKTVGGGLDASMGGIYVDFNPVIRVRHTEPVSEYGTLADLQTLYSLNDPNATPSNVITYIDHHGNSHDCLFVGDFRKAILGSMVEGSEAWFLIKCSFIKVPA